MSDVLLTWEIPPQDGSRRPIDYVRVDYRVDPSLPWTEQDRLAPNAAQELLFSDVPSGTHYYQVTVVDIDGLESPNPPQASATIDFNAPLDVINLVATVQ